MKTIPSRRVNNGWRGITRIKSKCVKKWHPIPAIKQARDAHESE
jgi:hypothetical protein